MADIRLTVRWTCGAELELARTSDGVEIVAPHRKFSVEPAKAELLAKLLAALAQYPATPPAPEEPSRG